MLRHVGSKSSASQPRRAIGLAVVICFICPAESFAVEPCDKSATGTEIRLAEDEPADELIEAGLVGTDDKVFLHKANVQ
ncbi:MAG: hypothetical protein CMJ64_15065 [Planctomycetaceae bacterium]|nr:hypothetical protein [Planctomycetaceae bacterium]